jgi:ribosomal protein S18 acetylase RimI-like enzyme
MKKYNRIARTCARDAFLDQPALRGVWYLEENDCLVVYNCAPYADPAVWDDERVRVRAALEAAGINVAASARYRPGTGAAWVSYALVLDASNDRKPTVLKIVQDAVAESMRQLGSPVPKPRLRVQIRLMRRTDLAEVLAIEDSNGPQSHFGHGAWTLEDFREAIADKPYKEAAVAVAGGKVVGYAVYILDVAEVMIHNLVVHPDCERQGVGRQLVAYAYTKTNPERSVIQAFVRDSNSTGKAFFRALRYRPITLEAGLFSSPAESALEYRMEIT